MELRWLGEGRSRGVFRHGVVARSRQMASPHAETRGATVQQLVAASIVLLVLVVSSAIAFHFLTPPSNDTPQRAVVVEKRTTVELVDVLVPVAQIEPNRPLEPNMFVRVRRPKDGLSAGIVRNFDQIRGHYSRALVPAHTPLHLDYVTSERPSNVVAASIPEGFRAVTIDVDAVSAVEGWAQAGARVDVSWITDRSGERVATTIVQNVKILSAERRIEPANPRKSESASVPTTVTLLAGDLDAQKISLAAVSGKLLLLLRGADDEAIESAGPVTLRDLVVRPGYEHSNERSRSVAYREGLRGRPEMWVVRGDVGGRSIENSVRARN